MFDTDLDLGVAPTHIICPHCGLCVQTKTNVNWAMSAHLCALSLCCIWYVN